MSLWSGKDHLWVKSGALKFILKNKFNFVLFSNYSHRSGRRSKQNSFSGTLRAKLVDVGEETWEIPQ
jgi:ribonucleotide monophosphatase NagD (HAD superfamily)